MLRVLEGLGFIIRRQRGSHLILRHPQTKRTTVIPMHAHDLSRGVLFSILKQAGISQDQFRMLL